MKTNERKTGQCKKACLGMIGEARGREEISSKIVPEMAVRNLRGESNPEATAGKATRGLNVVRKAGQETEMVEKERKGDVKETRAVDEDMNPMKTETGSGDVNNESVML
mmetsp:Transcript_23349/g.38410  ORF Transcript_23349/g.38410 Transcript_23349/m.38410 type:complete len:109 (+) Transcript_23349:1330-1656(+)